MLSILRRHSYTAIALMFGVLLLACAILFAKPPLALSAGAGVPLSGYGWSDTIGWIDFNCVNSGTCASRPFGIAIDGSGNLSGYAWSENIGWISANSSDLAGCPSAPCSASINSSGVLVGWLKAIAADGNGWDGWISLSGSGYSVTVTNGAFSGYAWGSDVVGWVDLHYASTVYGTCVPSYSCSDSQTIQYTNSSCQTTTYAACTSPNFCSAGSSVCLVPAITFVPSTSGPPGQTFAATGHLQIVPTLINSGNSALVYWNVNNAASCTVTGSNGDSWSGPSSGSAGKTTSPILQQTTYTLSCSGYPGATPPSISEQQIINVTPKFQER